MALLSSQPADQHADVIIAWRLRVLRRLGLPDALAQTVARTPEIDLGAIAGLIDRGCPPPTAVRILAPVHWPIQPERQAFGS